MKKILKKALVVLLGTVMAVPVFASFACSKRVDLKVYNCYDYMDETLISDFKAYYKEKTGKSITVQYSCYDTPEDLYNNLKIKGSDYDVVCPSDYMIEKMAREGMLRKITLPEDSIYNANVSPFIKEKFESVTWGDDNEYNLSQYAIGYMWGTMGLCYNPENVDGEDMKSWSTLWNTNASFSIKDSVRDTYFIGLAKKYQTELEANKALYESDYATYYANLKNYFNDTSETTVTQMESILRSLRTNSYGMEVDEGKDMIKRGETDVYFAWSGDAVYAMDDAEEVGKELMYSVPEEGSNIWFDGWCIPTTAKNPELAIEFMEFISRPDNVIKNMEYIGYVSCVASDDVFDWVVDTYGADEGEYEVNLNYFFKADGSDGDYTVVTDTLGRQFSAQYPDEEVIKRCVMMNYFPPDANERVTRMWIRVKS
ncbi:MAG: extracellular solute-binding protein [Clostridia bacterium]|nr:extracellular solute-binding protein [Clostridia bacterium]